VTMPHRLLKLTTQQIPAWSANLSANAPSAWRDELALEAKRLDIGLGELLRQLLLAGARVQLPKLAHKMLAAHREYYPKRAIMPAAVLVLFCVSLAAHDVKRTGRAVRLARQAQEISWES